MNKAFNKKGKLNFKEAYGARFKDRIITVGAGCTISFSSVVPDTFDEA